MLNRIREILLTQYIGSILIALLAVQAGSELISTVVRTGSWVFYEHQNASVLQRSSSMPFRWDALILAGVKIALYLLTAYGLAQWLHPGTTPISQDEIEGDSAPEASGPDEAQQL